MGAGRAEGREGEAWTFPPVSALSWSPLWLQFSREKPLW